MGTGGDKICKTWRLRNDGDQPFPAGCHLLFESGERCDGPVAGISVPRVQPLEEFDVTVPLVVPTSAGAHTSNWRLHAPSGRPFGDRCWVHIITKASTSVKTTMA